MTGTWLAIGAAAVGVVGFVLSFRAKLNASDVVETPHGVDGRIDAVEFFWRPG